MEYPIGTKIRYNPPGLFTFGGDKGKCGIIAGYQTNDIVKIVLPDSYIAKETYGDSSHWFSTYMKNLEILPQSGGQLLFDFMKE